MVLRSQDENVLREYLLGMLSEPLSVEIEKKLLTEDDFAETVSVIEDELIDDYFDGKLTSVEKRALENHFIRSPEHRRKVEFARLLRSHLQTPSKSAALYLASSFRFPMVSRVLWAGFACLLAISSGLGIYVIKLQQELATEKAKSRTNENSLQAMAEKLSSLDVLDKSELTTAKAVKYPAYGLLHLDLLSTQSRDIGSMPSIACAPAAVEIEVHIALVNGPLDSYDAVLHGPDERELWSKQNIRPVPVGSGKQLILKIPNTLPCHHQYSLALTTQGDLAASNYVFRVR